MMGSSAAEFPSTNVQSHPERAQYDVETACEILDDGRIGHLSTVCKDAPRIVPMMYVRHGDVIHIHCRRDTELAQSLLEGVKTAFAVTLTDGLVLAQDVRFHSVNYRSLVVYGRADAINDETEKHASFVKLAEGLWPGRVGLRPPTAEQLASVVLFAIPLEHFSIKMRTGPPKATRHDGNRSTWTGHVDLVEVPNSFHPDSATLPHVPAPNWPF